MLTRFQRNLTEVAEICMLQYDLLLKNEFGIVEYCSPSSPFLSIIPEQKPVSKIRPIHCLRWESRSRTTRRIAAALSRPESAVLRRSASWKPDGVAAPAGNQRKFLRISVPVFVIQHLELVPIPDGSPLHQRVIPSSNCGFCCFLSLHR